MPDDSRTERDQSRRCQSDFMERPDHTHHCRLHGGHVMALIQHECICSLKWALAKQEHE